MNWIAFHPDIERLLVALLIGAAIGAEREYRSKSAGLRTMILVCMGACLVTIVSASMGAPNNADRIAANIITGIGFLGAGVVFKEENRVTGITTATTIWMAAALGMEAGLGNFETAFICTAIVLIVLVVLVYVQNFISKTNQLRDYRIVSQYQDITIKKYEHLFKKHHLVALRGKQIKAGNLITGNWLVQGPVKCHESLILELLKDPDIAEFDF
jgi:putative Mg2+ transporter-C (MgtC) family protein